MQEFTVQGVVISQRRGGVLFLILSEEGCLFEGRHVCKNLQYREL